MAFKKLVEDRYSVRKFSEKPVEEEKIQSLLQVCRVAPTAHNNQPQRLLVISEPEALAKLPACTKCHFHAPLAILVCYDKTVAWKRREDGQCSGEVDTSIVGTHLMLHAVELGLGSCWVMAFDPDAVIAAFALPENLVPMALFPLGYPSEESVPSHLHEKRHPIEELVTYQTFAK